MFKIKENSQERVKTIEPSVDEREASLNFKKVQKLFKPENMKTEEMQKELNTDNLIQNITRELTEEYGSYREYTKSDSRKNKIFDKNFTPETQLTSQNTYSGQQQSSTSVINVADILNMDSRSRE